jgi:hypothetical protein
MRRIFLSGVGAAVLSLAVAVSPACTPKTPPAVATVGGQPILRDDFEDELRRVRAETGDLVLQKEIVASLKASVLNQMIEKRLLLNQAAVYGLEVTDGALEGEFKRFVSDYPDNTFEKSVKENFVNVQKLKERLRESMLMDMVLEEALGKTLEPDDEELVRYYRTRAGEFALQERVHLRQIVVRTRDEAEALRVRVTGGESFIELAKKHSLTPDAEKGGDIGVFAKGEMPPEFNQAFNIPVGEVSPVVQSSYGFHLFWVVERLPSRIPSFDEVRNDVRQRLRRERRENAYRGWIKQLRDEAGVRIYQDQVDSIQ